MYRKRRSPAVRSHEVEYIHDITLVRQPSLGDNIHVSLIAGYLAIAGIYWLPGFSYTLISQFKVVLYVLFVLIGLSRLRIYSVKQQRIYLWLLVCAFSAFLANVVTTDLDTAISQARNFVEPLLWLIALFGIRSCAYLLLFSRLKIALSIFFIISLYPVMIYIGLLPNSYAPDEFIDPTGLHIRNEWIFESASILGGGFNGGRTGWGVTVSTTALLLASLYIRERKTTKLHLIVVTIIIVGSVASIIVTGARGGTLALVTVSIYGVLLARGYGESKLLLFIGFFLLVVTSDLIALLPENILRNLVADGDLFTVLNTLSTGRLESYVGALYHFLESPLLGKGPVEATVVVKMVQVVSVHNLWLRQLAESGIIVFLPLLVLTLHVVLLALESPIKNDTKQRDLAWPPSRFVILCGLIMALVEPSVIIGSFNTNAVIWTAIWMVLARRRAQPLHQILHDRPQC